MNGARRTAAQVALAGYRLVRRTGLLDVPAVDRAFCGAYFAYKRYVEDPFNELVVAHPECFAPGSVLDVGANIGYTATVFAGAVRGDGKVFAFEPEAKNFQRLRRATQHLAAVEAHQLAVGSAPGEVELWHNADHHADHRVATEHFDAATAGDRSSIPMTSIDTFLEARDWPPIAFIKIDVQGYEIEVCRGMVNTLERNPQAAIAIEHSPDSSAELGFGRDDVLDFFAARGYQPLFLARGERLTPTTPAELAAESDTRGYVDVLYRR